MRPAISEVLTVSTRTVSRNPWASTTWISSPGFARSERARCDASEPRMIARSPSRSAKKNGNELHHRRGFVHRDAAAALEDRAAPRQLCGHIEVLGVKDRVAGGALADRTFRGGAVVANLVHAARERKSAIDHRLAEILVSPAPLLEHARVRGRRLRHSASIKNEHVLHASLLRNCEMSASACVSRSRFSGSFSQRLCPDGCGSGTIPGRSPNFLPTRDSNEPGPRKRT